MATTGEKIRQARENAGLTQKELADKLGLKNYQSISQYERGIRSPKYSTIEKISRVLGVPAESLSEQASDSLDIDMSKIFLDRVKNVLSVLDPADKILRYGKEDFYDYLFNENYKITTNDLTSFAIDNGISTDYLLGRVDDPLSWASKPKFVDELDYGLAVLRVQKFLKDNLHQFTASVEDAEVVANLIFDFVHPDNLIKTGWAIDAIPDKSKEALTQVFIAFVNYYLTEGGGWLNKLNTIATDKQVFISPALFEHSGEKGYYSVCSMDDDFVLSGDKGLSLQELDSFLRKYNPENNKPPQAEEDPSEA